MKFKKSSALKGQRHAHAATDAQSGQAFFGIAALHFVQQGHQNTAAGCTNRVPNGDRATIDIDLEWVNAQRLIDRAGLGRKGFVNFIKVKILQTLKAINTQKSLKTLNSLKITERPHSHKKNEKTMHG
jgi:hypothetical protein